jgi:hypothetical protein
MGNITETAAAARQEINRHLRRHRLLLSRQMWILVSIVFAGAVLRLYLLADKSIWLDEAFSISISQRGLGDLLQMVVRTDVHPPLYYIMLKFWLLLGQGAGHIRLLSALFSIASIALMYLVVSSLFDDSIAGLIGAGILAISPFHIWYAQEARMYALLTFFVLASAYFLILALRHGSLRYWSGYVLSTVLALYTDNGAMWYFLGVTAFYLLSMRRFPGRTRGWLLSQIGILLLYVPWVPFLWQQSRQVTDSFWLSPPSFQSVLAVFLDFNSFNFPWIALSVLYMTVIFVWSFIIPDRGWQRRLATMWLFIPLALSLLISLKQPVFLSRNLIIVSIGYYLLIVGTIKKFGSVEATAALLLPLLVMNLVSIGHNAWQEEKENWQALTEHVVTSARNMRGGLVLFVPPYAELPFAYYIQQFEVSLETQGYPESEILLHPKQKRADNPADVLEGRPYVWLVLRDVETANVHEPIIKWLDSHGYVRNQEFVRNDISVQTYTLLEVQDDPWLEPSPVVITGTESKLYIPALFNHSEKPMMSTAHVVITGTESKLYIPALFNHSEEPMVSTVHIVVAGETLSGIARRYETTVEALVNANNFLNPNRLSVGQHLIIP